MILKMYGVIQKNKKKQFKFKIIKYFFEIFVFYDIELYENNIFQKNISFEIMSVYILYSVYKLK